MKEALTTRPWTAAFCGLAALAVAMGIGRFAFTPILPMMQEDFGVTVAEGGWLASANYLGYLVGALTAMGTRLRQSLAIRLGLLIIALTTLAMGVADAFAAWMALRAIPGFASAWVLVYVSAWALERLGKAARPDLGGIVYAGVGSGIIFAGGACLLLSHGSLPSRAAWVVLGIAALCITAVLWRPVEDDAKANLSTPPTKASPRDIPEFWRLVFCYGAFGLGYIIPATFLPVMAKQIVSNPLWFGWAWPVFGAAAVVSTLLAARISLLMGQRAVWILANLVMAAGVLIPIAVPGLPGIVISALFVGGTFMVNTMVGLQEARRVAGAHARVLMAAMTAAFAIGQIVGPLLVGSFIDMDNGFFLALCAADIPLLLAAYILFMNRGAALQTAATTTR
jgi:predicted MFS family arabinose efflux permease